MFRNARQNRARRAALLLAREELEGMRAELGEAYVFFNHIAEPELLDACIFQISALRSRYNAALGRFKRELGDAGAEGRRRA
jgi:hypothetical protein